MTDVMVDLETTGTNPHTNGILQLAAVKFNYSTGEVDGVFDECPMMLPFRHWSESTRNWWHSEKKSDILKSFIPRQKPAAQVFAEFDRWIGSEPLRFWSKPTHFDWSFIAGYYEQLGRPIPFFYRTARDLNSFMAGLSGCPDHPDVEELVGFGEKGELHNALHDCAIQIEGLMFQKNRYVSMEQMN